MKLQNKKVVIIGAGPGGLTLAKLLQDQNIAVTVYERDIDKHARVQGSPLDLHKDSGLAAIKKANLFEEFKKHYLPRADREKIMNEKADVLFSDHEAKLAEDFGNPHFRPETHLPFF